MPKRSRIDLADILGLLGFVLLEIGVSLVSTPVAFIVAGCVLIAVAIGPDLRRR